MIKEGIPVVVLSRKILFWVLLYLFPVFEKETWAVLTKEENVNF